MLRIRNTARLAVTAGLCASITLGGLPVAAVAAEAGEPASAGAVASASVEAPAAEVPADERPATAVAGDETAPSTYEVDGQGDVTIHDLEAFKYFRDQVNAGNAFSKKTVTLAADIDLGDAEWTPVGTKKTPFKGVFDGGGHIISNLKISAPKTSDVGLFGYTLDGELKNFTVHNAHVTGRLDVGAIAGTPYTSRMTGLKLTGDVQIKGYAYVGGMFGKNAYANLTGLVIDANPGSLVSADSEGYRTYVGGVVGFMGEGGHVVSDVRSNISVIGTSCDVGGIAGIAHYGNTFKDCVVAEGVTVALTNADPADVQEIGGVAGVWYNQRDAAVTFENCSFGGTLSAADNTGKDHAAAVAGNAMAGKAYSAPSDTTGGNLYIINGDVKTIVPGGTTELKAALKDIKSNTVIRLTADIAADVVIPEGVSATIDLAGRKLTNESGHTIVNNGTIRIIDSVGGGVVDNTTNAKGALVNHGEAEVVGGKLTRSAETGKPGGAGANSWYVIKNDGVLKVSGGEVTNASKGSSLVCNAGKGKMRVTGGSFSNTFITLKNEEEATLEVTGGTVTSDEQSIQNWGTAQVTGGELDGDFITWAYEGTSSKTVIGGDAVVNGDVAAVDYDKGAGKPSVAVTGGTINGDVYKGEYNNKTGRVDRVEPTADSSQIVISGGSFKEPVSEEFVSPDSGLVENPDGGWDVHVHVYENEAGEKRFVEVEGGHREACVLCGEAHGDVIPHAFATDAWVCDGSSHWHACADCGAKGDASVHASGKWVANATDHWKKCDVCGTEFAIGAHEFGEWKVTKRPSDTEAGSRERVCKTCGMVETEGLPALDEGALAQAGDASMAAVAAAGIAGAAAVAAGAFKRRRRE